MKRVMLSPRLCNQNGGIMAGYRRLMVGLAVAALAAGSGSGARGMQADTERT
jgi:hypothetical protein